jgi:hypothetical protein
MHSDFPNALYFIPCYGAVILSFNNGKLLFHCIATPYGGLYICTRGLENLSLTCELYNLVLLDCQLILKTVVSPEHNNLFYLLYLETDRNIYKMYQ